MNALSTLDFSDDAITSIWKLVAAILHIGNMEFFTDENDKCNIRDSGLVDNVADLLGVSVNELQEALLTRVIAARGDVCSSRSRRSSSSINEDTLYITCCR